MADLELIRKRKLQSWMQYFGWKFGMFPETTFRMTYGPPYARVGIDSDEWKADLAKAERHTEREMRDEHG